MGVDIGVAGVKGKGAVFRRSWGEWSLIQLPASMPLQGLGSPMIATNNQSKISKHFGARRFIEDTKSKIHLMLIIIPALFVFVRFNVADLINNINPPALLRTTIGVYYFSWVFGLRLDWKMQEEVYLYDPNGGKVPVGFFVSCTSMLVFAVLMLFFIDIPAYFASFLSVFFVANVAAILIYQRAVSRIIEDSHLAYQQEGDVTRLEQVASINEYIRGRWQRYRSVALLFLLIPIDVICFSETVRDGISRAVVLVNSEILPSALNAALPAAAVGLFLGFAEAWQWKRRAETWISISVLKKLGNRLSIAD